MKKFFVSFLLALALSLSLPLAQGAAIAITAGNFLPSSSAVYLAGDHYAKTTITAGQAVYYDTSIVTPAASTPDIGLATASGAGDAVKAVGFAATGGGAGQPIKVLIRDPALALGGTVAAGDVVYLHNTAGSVTSTYADITTGGYVQVFGIGIGGNKINFGGSSFIGLGWLGVIRADVAK
jgi:hypothetical protein